MNELKTYLGNVPVLDEYLHWYVLHPNGNQVYQIVVPLDSDGNLDVSQKDAIQPSLVLLDSLKREEEFQEFIRDRIEGVLFSIFLDKVENSPFGNGNIHIPEDSRDQKRVYNQLIYSICLHRAWMTCIQSKFDAHKTIQRVDAACRQADRILKWLESTDFFTAPASTRFHDSCDGGLLRHTLNVVHHILNLFELPEFRLESVSCSSAILVALVHDWIKINYYEKYLKNVKNEAGQWVQEAAYKYSNSEPYPFGHGVGSMYIVQKMFQLSMDEALAIRWHMGPWNMHTYESNELQASNKTYPLVHMLQFADQLSITDYC